jgi:hypothetical protein
VRGIIKGKRETAILVREEEYRLRWRSRRRMKRE